jgi:hypothetical protein
MHLGDKFVVGQRAEIEIVGAHEAGTSPQHQPVVPAQAGTQ